MRGEFMSKRKYRHFKDKTIETEDKSVSEQRDAQFLGSAERTIKAIEGILYPMVNHPTSFDVRKACIELVAQYAYDLVEHTIGSINPIAFQSCKEWTDIIKDIPDMTE
jgi:hypothetical protein